MGLTPLDGLVMGTRSGRIDPSIIKFMHDETGMDIDEIKNGLSLKLLEMMDIVRDKNEWGETEIAEFGKLAKERLKNAITK